ncbi:MAG: hypothetical protein ACPL3P_06305 [Anaerolineales bacterium]
MKKIKNKAISGLGLGRILGWIRQKFSAPIEGQAQKKNEKRWVDLNSVGIFGGHH